MGHSARTHASRGSRDLREELISAATEAIEAKGLSAVSMRSVARQVDVSHTAPLRHFAGFADLLAEVAARGFADLQARVERASDGEPAGAGAIARLTAACQEYIAFAVERPELFSLMFMWDAIEVTNPEYDRRSRAAHETFLRLVRHAQDAGFASAMSTADANAAVWSMVHGFAALWRRGPLQSSLGNPTDPRPVVERALRLLTGGTGDGPASEV